MHKLLRKKPDIINWLDKYEITNYNITADSVYGHVVNVFDSVELYEKNLDYIAVKFNFIEEDFDISVNNLKSLYGAPEIVNGSFNCEKNRLTSLEYSPQIVKDNFCAANNTLETIKGISRFIGYNVWLSYNQLRDISLEDLPHSIVGHIFMEGNPLANDIIKILNPQILKDTLQTKQEHKDLTHLISESHLNSKAVKL